MELPAIDDFCNCFSKNNALLGIQYFDLNFCFKIYSVITPECVSVPPFPQGLLTRASVPNWIYPATSLCLNIFFIDCNICLYCVKTIYYIFPNNIFMKTIKISVVYCSGPALWPRSCGAQSIIFVSVKNHEQLINQNCSMAWLYTFLAVE